MFPSPQRVGPVAQLVEQLTFNQLVAGSIPAGLTSVFLRSRVASFVQIRFLAFSHSSTRSAISSGERLAPRRWISGDSGGS